MKRIAAWTMFAVLTALACLPPAGCQNPSPGEIRARAISEHQLGRPDAAEDLFRQVLDIRPSDTESLYYMGEILFSRGRYAEAYYYYQSAIDTNPGHAGAREGMAKTERALGPKADELRFIPRDSSS